MTIKRLFVAWCLVSVSAVIFGAAATMAWITFTAYAEYSCNVCGRRIITGYGNTWQQAQYRAWTQARGERDLCVMRGHNTSPVLNVIEEKP